MMPRCARGFAGLVGAAGVVLAGAGGPVLATVVDEPKATRLVATSEPASNVETDLPVCRSDWEDQIESMSGCRQSSVVSAWLRNGVRVHHMPIDTPPGGVLVAINFFGGELLESASNRGVSTAACSAWDELSVDRLPPARVPSCMEGRDAHIEAAVGPDLIQIRLWGRPSDIEEGMRVVAALLHHPRVTSATLESTITTALRAMKERAANEPELVGAAIVDAVFPADEVRVRPPTPAQLLSITPEQAQRVLDEHIAHAPVEVSIVGGISLDDALRLAGGFLSNLPTRPRVSEGVYADKRRLPAPVYPMRRELKRPIEPGTAVVVVGFPGPDATELADLRTLRAAARILGERASRALRTAGFENTRADGAAIPGGIYPGFGVVACSVRVPVEQAEQAADTIEAAIREMASGGVTSGEVESASGELAKAFTQFDRQPRYWSAILARLDSSGLDLEEVAGGEAFYRSLNPETVSAAVRRNVGDARILRLIVRSDKGAAGEDAAP